MEESKKHCDFCDVDFSRTRDYERHIKTNKHLKNELKIDKTKCPYCDYNSNDNSNMHKHIKKQHNDKKILIEEKIEKDNNNIPKNIIKSYLLLKEAQLTYALKLSAFKCRYNRLKNRLFKDTDNVILETRNGYNLAYMDYKNIQLKIEELLVDYPNLVNEEIPTKNIDTKYDEKEEIIEDKQLQENKMNQDIKFDKINKIKNDIEILLNEYKNSRGDKNILNKIFDKENELNKIN